MKIELFNAKERLKEMMQVALTDYATGEISKSNFTDIEIYSYEEINEEFIIFVTLSNGTKKVIFEQGSDIYKFDSKDEAFAFCEDMNKIVSDYKLGLAQRDIRKKVRKYILNFNPKTREEFNSKEKEIKTYISFLDLEIKPSHKLSIWCNKIIDKKGMLLCAITNG